MWKCKTCGADIEDNSWETCWQCGHNKSGEKSELEVKDEPFDPLPKAEKLVLTFDNVFCTRCKIKMNFVGNHQIHSGSAFAGVFLGDCFGVDRTNMALFLCSRCRQVEFFACEVVKPAGVVEPEMP